MSKHSLNPKAKYNILNFKHLLETCINDGESSSHSFFKKDGEDFIYKSGVPFPNMNGIVSFKTSPDEISDKLHVINESFNEDDKIITWIWPYSDKLSEQSKEVLNQAGFESIGEHSLISIEPDAILSKPFELPDHQSIKLVKTDDDFYHFMNITQTVFGLAEKQTEKLSGLYRAYKSTEHIKLYLGLIDDEPVSVLQTYENDGVVGLYNGATLPTARKSHLFTRLIQYALQQVSSPKLVVGQLMPSKEAMGVLKFFECSEVGSLMPFCKCIP